MEMRTDENWKMSDIVNNLFRYLPKERVATFSCGHIIPEANLRTIALAKGNRNQCLKLNASALKEKTTVRLHICIMLNSWLMEPC
jgi:chromosome transmission fidelity protein 1